MLYVRKTIIKPNCCTFLFRSASITEDGITTRYREESREGSVSTSRDSGISSIQENSVLDLPSRRDSSVSRNSSDLRVTDSLEEFRNKYSPANYVPACQRRNNMEYMSRSKSINDIGLPPIERSDSKTLKKKVRKRDFRCVCVLFFFSEILFV